MTNGARRAGNVTFFVLVMSTMNIYGLAAVLILAVLVAYIVRLYRNKESLSIQTPFLKVDATGKKPARRRISRKNKDQAKPGDP